jgi:hypothetical protein
MHLVTSAVAKPILAATGCSALFFIAGQSTADQTCARQERGLRAFARKGLLQRSSGLEGNRLLGKAGVRRTDPLGRSMLDLFPHAADLQTWVVSLVAQTGW